MNVRTAILVDGAFYQKRASILFGMPAPNGPVLPRQRADELITYCNRHIKQEEGCSLYKIFYYDCPPSEKVIYHPLTRQNVYLKNTPLYEWSTDFFQALASKRKVVIRRGELLESTAGYLLKEEATKALCAGTKRVEDLVESDFYLDIKQKGVDMRIGLDISSLAYKRQADRIVLIAGDSDFVPAAKHARREGVDFVLDPMWYTIKESLNEHIDGLASCVSKPPNNKTDPLYKGY